MNTVYIVTQNHRKFRDLKRELGKHSINLQQIAEETFEIQADTCEEVAAYSAKQSAQKYDKPIVKGDFGVFIECLNGLPGVYVKEVVEKIGVSRSYESISKAQFVLVVLDSSSKLTKEDEEILEYSKDKERIIVVNKIDLDKKLELDEKLIEQEDIIFITTQSDTDYTKIVAAIENKLGLNKFDSSMHSYLTNARHIAQIEKSKQAFDRALLNIKNGELIDIIQIDLQQAWYELGEILGENDVDSLLDEMFAKFCLGK